MAPPQQRSLRELWTHKILCSFHHADSVLYRLDKDGYKLQNGVHADRKIASCGTVCSYEVFVGIHRPIRECPRIKPANTRDATGAYGI